MGRLTERFSNGQAAVYGCGYNCKHDFKYCNTYNENCPTMCELYEKLATYEDLEEQGLLHKAQLKDGTPIWYVLNIFDEGMYVTNTIYIFGVTEYEIGEFGKKFWLSEAEAEKALEEMEKEDE